MSRHGAHGDPCRPNTETTAQTRTQGPEASSEGEGGMKSAAFGASGGFWGQNRQSDLRTSH